MITPTRPRGQRNNFGGMEGEDYFKRPVREVGYPKLLVV
jgi:hypothetical protein